jgi:hypothetical protein
LDDTDVPVGRDAPREEEEMGDVPSRGESEAGIELALALGAVSGSGEVTYRSLCEDALREAAGGESDAGEAGPVAEEEACEAFPANAALRGTAPDAGTATFPTTPISLFLQLPASHFR